MRFFERKHRSPPPIIIVSLIDILIVLLIFLMVTTTFKQQPAVKLTLPESREGREGRSQSETAVITIARETNGSRFFIGEAPVTLAALRTELSARAAKDPNTAVAIRSDRDASVQDFLDVVEAVKAAGIRKPVSTFTKNATKR